MPAFYGRWFMGRVREGFAGVVHPFGGKRYVVSLTPEDVACFVFWSKDFTPFLDDLETLDRLGYRFYFNYTVTAVPQVFESDVDRAAALRTLKHLSRRYSPAHINWRFDPIVLSSVCDGEFYLREFGRLAGELEGLVERCYFSFVMPYRKVDRNFRQLEQAQNLRIVYASEGERIELAGRLAETIVKFREQRGWINNLEELTDIQQVNAGGMEHLREWLTTASDRTGALEYQGQKEEPDAA